MADNSIAVAREQKIFVAIEDTRGTLKFPSATDFVIGAGFGSINQTPDFTDSEEVRNSRDILTRFQDRFKPGEWEIPMYARPSGSLGVAPMASNIYEAFFGVKTINGGTSVVYSQAIAKPSVSIWIQKDHTVLWARGATVSKLEPELVNTGAFKIMCSGQFMEQGWVGSDKLNGGEPISETNIVVDDAKKYKAGGKVKFKKVSTGTYYTNAGSGYLISSVTIATNTLVISPGLEIALDDDDLVEPFLPTGTVVGNPVESRKGKANIDSVDTPVKTLKFEINDPAQYLEDEITLTEYPDSYVEATREITGEMAIYFRENDMKYFYDGQNNSIIPLEMISGTVAGSIVTFALPQASVEVPSTEEDDPTMSLSMNFTATGSSGEDSCTLTFT
jgi:hypothetical protein